GLVEVAPGFRSILVSYRPEELAVSDLLDHLQAVHTELPAERERQWRGWLRCSSRSKSGR
ncbi:MAG TPA: hypothetical protein VE780_16800, partial [Thermoleophilaceae bacterium]|nr:hypothetical protein [Thermoleophilaceae bacterium]